jgi:CheY-like chemotaxis protein
MTVVRPRILLAENDPNDVEMTLAALGDHQITHEVVVVSDGAQAMDYLHSHGEFASREPGDPVVVLLDLKMPKLDGLEVLRTMKTNQHFRAIPVVMLTSSREERDLALSYELGVNAFIVKPVEFSAFIRAVKQLSAFWTIHNHPPPTIDRGGSSSRLT